MNLAQSLGAAAAALFVGLYPLACGFGVSVASAQEAAAQGGALTRDAIRAAARELADLMEASYVFPEQADRYAAHLRQRAAAGAYDQMTDPAVLASTLQAELRGVHQDAHLRISPVRTTETAGRRIVRGGPSGEFAEAQWLTDGVAYLRINSLPGGDGAKARMAALLDQYKDAGTLIIDVRACPGGTLPAMDALFSHLYAQPTFVMTMDTRTGANPQMERDFEDTPTLRRAANAPRGITRFEHWSQPTNPVSSLSDARVFVLTGRTGSACEHLSQALRETGRATLIGSNTGGAGHYGGSETFGGGRFEMFLPVGNSYAPGAESWEGVGVAPHIRVEPANALAVALREAGLDAELASAVQPPARMYGIAMAPQAGAGFITIDQVIPGHVAAASGLRGGDRIIAVNGRPVRELSEDQFGAAMRGERLTLDVEREGQRLTFNMSLQS